MNKQLFDSAYFSQKMMALQEQAPLVHCLTNDVVTNFTANVLLSVGACPAMVVAEQESTEFVVLASALLVNVGTLTLPQAHAMGSAVRAAAMYQKPWVLDPVAYGVLKFRTDVCDELLAFPPMVIRGNAAEICAMAGAASQSKGPESLVSSNDALEHAKAVAKKYKTVVAMTGQTDFVTDGELVYALHNGHEFLTRVTGAGCALSALVAAYCVVCETPMLAALTALSHMAVAGELAAKRAQGVGSFAVALLDYLQWLAREFETQQSVQLRCELLPL